MSLLLQSPNVKLGLGSRKTWILDPSEDTCRRVDCHKVVQGRSLDSRPFDFYPVTAPELRGIDLNQRLAASAS